MLYCYLHGSIIGSAMGSVYNTVIFLQNTHNMYIWIAHKDLRFFASVWLVQSPLYYLYLIVLSVLWWLIEWAMKHPYDAIIFSSWVFTISPPQLKGALRCLFIAKVFLYFTLLIQITALVSLLFEFVILPLLKGYVYTRSVLHVCWQCWKPWNIMTWKHFPCYLSFVKTRCQQCILLAI